MEFINLILKLLGLDVVLDDETSPFLVFVSGIFCMSLITLLSFINILIYTVILYITEHKLFLDKINKYPFLVKVIGYYRKTRLSFLIIEVLFFTFSLLAIIYLSYKGICAYY